MTTGRLFHATVVLPDGGVFVASNTTAERYDEATDVFTFVGNLNANRGIGLTATLLLDGRVLIVGGQAGDTSEASAEIYDPVTGMFTQTGSMATPRSFHTATRLGDGRVLVAGGHQFNHPSSSLATAEIYDPTSGSFSSTGNMADARQDHTAALLPDGRVLIAGGYQDLGGLAKAEIYDPSTGTFSAAASMNASRGNHTATPLANGNILILGGHLSFPGDSLASAEIYDVGNGTFGPAGTMTVPRGAHTATPLMDGTILVAGGFTSFPFGGTILSSAEIYDPATGVFTPTGNMPVARGRFIAAALPSGDVLVAGGQGACCGGGLANAEVFTTSLVDTEPPVITVPPDLSVFASGPDGANVFFAASATDDVDGNPQVSCEPPSGSLFPIGTTLVVCTATDSSANSSTASFSVTVIELLNTTIALSSSGTVNPKTGIATVSGTVSCSRPTQFFNVSGELKQIISKRAVLSGFYFTQVSCAGSGTWSATVTPSNGRFKAGKAEGWAFGFACDQLGSCDSSEVSAVAIQLRSKK